MFRRYLDGLCWGAGFGTACVIAVLALAFVNEKLFDYEPAIPQATNWSEFRVLSSAHRLVTDTEYHDGIYVSGEIEFQDLPAHGFYYVIATLRNREGVVLQSCHQKYLITMNRKTPFSVHCDEVFSEEEVGGHEISVEVSS